MFFIKKGAASGTRTRTAIPGQGILSPSCLPFHHRGIKVFCACKDTPIIPNCQIIWHFFALLDKRLLPCCIGFSVLCLCNKILTAAQFRPICNAISAKLVSKMGEFGRQKVMFCTMLCRMWHFQLFTFSSLAMPVSV